MATASNTATIARKPAREASDGASARLLARAGIVAGALALVAVVVPASLASWAAVDHPALAAKIAPWDAASATAAAAALGNPRGPEVRALVGRALGRDLTQVQAIELRALDLALSGQTTNARKLFQLSDRLSRRSLPTRLWLIQDSVDRGNVAGALRNFEVALRTTTDAQPILFPVLAKASADPTLTVPLARLLDRPSEWRQMFFEWVLLSDGDVGPLANVVSHMRDKQFLAANADDQRLIERLVTAREFAQARFLNASFGRPTGLIADPSFRDSAARYPFGWGLVSNGSLGAERALDARSTELSYRAAPANSGQVAAQLLTLVPGRYALSTRTAESGTGGVPYWSVTCGESGGAELARLDQPMVASDQAEVAFTVPPGCSGQWLTLRVRPASDSSSQSGSIAWVRVNSR